MIALSSSEKFEIAALLMEKVAVKFCGDICVFYCEYYYFVIIALLGGVAGDFDGLFIVENF